MHGAKQLSRRLLLRERIASAEVFFSIALSEAHAVAIKLEMLERKNFACGLCAATLRTFWNNQARKHKCAWDIRKPVATAPSRDERLARRLGTALADMPISQAGFMAGQLYTTLLPDDTRKRLGAYYTPPALVARLLELVSQSGFDWKKGRILDPACGGAAFLASIAPKLAEHSAGTTPLEILEDIECRLNGIEIDVFAAWMSLVLLDVSLLRLTVAAKRPLKPVVIAQDAFEIDAGTLGQFDLVIGNPPYGKVSLSVEQRHRFQASLYGHANLYGLFTELAVRLTGPRGLIAYVTPTSFLGGEYFKNLRTFLASNAPVQMIDFVSDRDGVFNGVLQETMLAVFGKQKSNKPRPVLISEVNPDSSMGSLIIKPAGTAIIPANHGSPWIIPRSQSQAALVQNTSRMPTRLKDYGYSISTGQLVWNRHKALLRPRCETACYPIIWAEAISAGKFQFQATRKTHLPYIKWQDDESCLINQEPCVLVQRTTSKEQRRRLVAAVIPNAFVLQHPGFVVENHLNMIYPNRANPPVGLAATAVLLNSTVVDQVFRCISGSVAVSAYELNSLPVPDLNQIRQLEDLVLSEASQDEIESLIQRFYTTQNERRKKTSRRHSRRNHRKMAA